jgi:hypothetical protein
LPENIFETLSIAFFIFTGLFVFGITNLLEQAYTYLFSATQPSSQKAYQLGSDNIPLK